MPSHPERACNLVSRSLGAVGGRHSAFRKIQSTSSQISSVIHEILWPFYVPFDTHCCVPEGVAPLGMYSPYSYYLSLSCPSPSSILSKESLSNPSGLPIALLWPTQCQNSIQLTKALLAFPSPHHVGSRATGHFHVTIC